jgi:SAM-dependent methyltransferase
LHPQWLVTRMQHRRTAWIAGHARGVVVDVGCADGAIKAVLSAATDYIGLDYPATADRLYFTRPAIYADAASLPLQDASCDTLMLLDVVEHLAAPEAAMAEAHRVLRPGGCALITIPFAYPLHDQPHDYQRYTHHGLSHRLHAVGFREVRIEEVGDAIAAAASNLAIAIAQGALDAGSQRRWRLIALPLAPIMVPLINIFGWIMGALLPARHFMPGGYYVRALR